MNKRRAQRPARAHRYVVPSRDEVKQRLLDLADGNSRRDQAEDWAAEFVIYDDPQLYPEIDDPMVWDAIKAMAGCATLIAPDDYLYGAEDLRAWAALLEKSNGP